MESHGRVYVCNEIVGRFELSFLNAINVERYGLIAEDVKKGSLAQMRAE